MVNMKGVTKEILNILNLSSVFAVFYWKHAKATLNPKLPHQKTEES